jgi:UDP-N-acetylmuramoyl-L-alanyl-D-glutamate--2,6-diaminopimelate ligase
MNSDDEHFNEMSSGLDCKVITYSTVDNAADYTAKNIVLRPDGVDFAISGIGVIGRIKTKIGGKFTPYNALCAASCAISLGINIDTVCEAFAEMSGVKGRAEVVPNDFGFTVIIDYAHTPDGLENILKTFDDCEKNRLISVFGCGGDRDRTKRPKMGAIAAANSDYVIVTSDNPRTEDPNAIIKDILEGMKDTKTHYEVIESRIEAIKKAVHIAKKGDIIVLAGKGHETYQILKSGTIHLDEREVVAEAFAEIAKMQG